MNKENITAEPDRSITDRPSVVRETQIMLTRLALHSEKHAELSPLHVGGSLDDPTRKEIEKFQRIEGMNADGELDIDTYNTLKGSYAAVHEKLSPPHGVAPVQSSLQNGISAGEESVRCDDGAAYAELAVRRYGNSVTRRAIRNLRRADGKRDTRATADI